MISKILSIIVLLFCVIASAQQTVREQGSNPKHGPGSVIWEKVLEEFVRHDDAAKAFIKEIAEDSKEFKEQRLATLLLEQWDLPSDAQALTQPIPIEMPDLSTLKGKVQGGAFPVEVQVDPIGKVIRARFVRPYSDPDVEAAILKEVEQVSFRPSFANGKFTSGSAIMMLNIDVR